VRALKTTLVTLIQFIKRVSMTVSFMFLSYNIKSNESFGVIGFCFFLSLLY
jgi:hypothetical protein